MGGVVVNGFGAEDKFKTIKYLGEFVCPHCKKSSQFTLDEVNRKIVLLFIPTVSYSTKYAIMCKKCQLGDYISEYDKNRILNGTATVDFSAGRMQIIDVNTGGGGSAPINNSAQTVNLNNNINNDTSAQNMIICPGCGKEINAVGRFCNLCGANITMPEPEPEPDPKPAPERLFCNQCGKEVAAGSAFCNHCGNKLDENPSGGSDDKPYNRMAGFISGKD